MRYIIKGWGGEHDETGAVIFDTQTGIKICHTASEAEFGSWTDYHDNAERIVAALNIYDGMFGDQVIKSGRITQSGRIVYEGKHDEGKHASRKDTATACDVCGAPAGWLCRL